MHHRYALCWFVCQAGTPAVVCVCVCVCVCVYVCVPHLLTMYLPFDVNVIGAQALLSPLLRRHDLDPSQLASYMLQPQLVTPDVTADHPV